MPLGHKLLWNVPHQILPSLIHQLWPLSLGHCLTTMAQASGPLYMLSPPLHPTSVCVVAPDHRPSIERHRCPRCCWGYELPHPRWGAAEESGDQRRGRSVLPIVRIATRPPGCSSSRTQPLCPPAAASCNALLATAAAVAPAGGVGVQQRLQLLLITLPGGKAQLQAVAVGWPGEGQAQCAGCTRRARSLKVHCKELIV